MFQLLFWYIDGTAVDPDSGLQDVAHVYCEGKLKYFAVLCCVDIAKDKNSYYKIQLLESDDHRKLVTYLCQNFFFFPTHTQSRGDFAKVSEYS